jgi:hypothetical protein
MKDEITLFRYAKQQTNATDEACAILVLAARVDAAHDGLVGFGKQVQQILSVWVDRLTSRR